MITETKTLTGILIAFLGPWILAVYANLRINALEEKLASREATQNESVEGEEW